MKKTYRRIDRFLQWHTYLAEQLSVLSFSMQIMMLWKIKDFAKNFWFSYTLLHISSFFFAWKHCSTVSMIYILVEIEHKLLQIWKSQHMFKFILKQRPENFAFLILRFLELFTREVCIFLKSRLFLTNSIVSACL